MSGDWGRAVEGCRFGLWWAWAGVGADSGGGLGGAAAATSQHAGVQQRLGQRFLGMRVGEEAVDLGNVGQLDHGLANLLLSAASQTSRDCSMMVRETRTSRKS